MKEANERLSRVEKEVLERWREKVGRGLHCSGVISPRNWVVREPPVQKPPVRNRNTESSVVNYPEQVGDCFAQQRTLCSQ
jgi:hypothetical protein